MLALLLSAENSPPSECRGTRNESERWVFNHLWEQDGLDDDADDDDDGDDGEEDEGDGENKKGEQEEEEWKVGDHWSLVNHTNHTEKEEGQDDGNGGQSWS